MFSGISTPEMLMFGIVALLLFGKNLPDVARSVGKSVVEFKKGMKGFEKEFRNVMSEAESPVPHRSSAPARRPEPVDDQQKWTAPRFDPPTSEPQS